MDGMGKGERAATEAQVSFRVRWNGDPVGASGQLMRDRLRGRCWDQMKLQSKERQ